MDSTFLWFCGFLIHLCTLLYGRTVITGTVLTSLSNLKKCWIWESYNNSISFICNLSCNIGSIFGAKNTAFLVQKCSILMTKGRYGRDTENLTPRHLNCAMWKYTVLLNAIKSSGNGKVMLVRLLIGHQSICPAWESEDWKCQKTGE